VFFKLKTLTWDKIQLKQLFMKKTIALIMMCGTLSIGAFAQGASFGIKGGLNLAKETATGSGLSISSDSRTSFHFGVYTTIMFSDKFGLQPELLYSGQGAGSGSSADKFSYLAIPIMLKYHVNPIFSLQAGPQLGFLMSATSAGTDVKDQMNSTDFAGAFGLGVDLPMGLNFAARYVPGFSNILKSTPSGVTLKNETIQISVGFTIVGAGDK
jgi:hypothetical protein